MHGCGFFGQGKRAKNVSAKSAIKTASRKVLDAVAAGNAEEAKACLHLAGLL